MICSCLPYCCTQHRRNLVTQLFPPGFTPPVFCIRLAPDTHALAIFPSAPIILICWFGSPTFLTRTFAGPFAEFFTAKLLVKPVPRIRSKKFFASRTFAAGLFVFHLTQDRQTYRAKRVGIFRLENIQQQRKKNTPPHFHFLCHDVENTRREIHLP